MQFYDLKNQYKSIRRDFLKRFARIHSTSAYILGEELKCFEKEFSLYCGVKYAVGVNSGTDALFLSLKCLGIGRGDEVIVPVFSFIATSFCVTMTGATPVFVDIDRDTYGIDSRKIERSITKKTKAIIPVHLFGLCANMPEITTIARCHKLSVIEDAAQAHGAQIKGAKAGSLGAFGCFSFYPTKNLSAFGDAGLITTNSKKHYERLLQLRDCGRAKERYLHPVLGYNSRLDNIQAACLRLKLKKLDRWNRQRVQCAAEYSRFLRGIDSIITPHIPPDYVHVFHVYSIRTKKRKQLIEAFKRNRIPHSIFYQLPLHLQKANKNLGYKRGNFPAAELVSEEIIALPVHSRISEKDIRRIARLIREVHHG